MKIFLLSTLVTSALSASAQITVNSSDLMSIGLTVEQVYDTTTVVTIGSNGANQIWDYSNLAQDRLDLITFVDPVTLPGNTNFTSSNMGSANSSGPDVSLFLTKNSSELHLDGAYININPFYAIPINETLLTFPSTMGTNFNTSIVKEVTNYPVMVDPDLSGPADFIYELKVISSVDLTSQVDGWGDLTTPLGTFASLRQTVYQQSHDTTYVRTQATPYWHVISTINAAALGVWTTGTSEKRTARWWTNNPSSQFVLLEMNYQASGVVDEVFWQKSNLSVGLEAMAIQNVSVYPNPATSHITIETDSNVESVSIINLAGNVVQLEATNSFSVDGLSSGVYIIHVRTNTGTLQSRFVKE